MPMWRYKRRKSLKKKLNAKRKAKTTYSQRRRRRTYRYKARAKSRYCGEGSVLTGYSVTEPTKLNQQFQDGYVKWDQNGDIVSDSNDTVFLSTLSVNPLTCIGLYERLKLYRYFRIVGVEYEFYKDSLQGTGVVSASYAGEWDYHHSKLIYNENNDATPGQGEYTQLEALKITQLKGVHLDTLKGRRKFVKVHPRVKKLTQLENYAGNYANVNTVSRYPWMETSDFGLAFDTALVDVYIPLIALAAFFDPTATAGQALESNTKKGRETEAAPFQWYVRAKIKWQLKGKYYTNVDTPPTYSLVKDMNRMQIKNDEDDDYKM